MALTTIALVKSIVAKTGTDHDTILTHYVEVVSSWLTAFCKRRTFTREVGRVEYPRGGWSRLQLDVYPIETVTEIRQSTALPRDYAGEDALVEGTDFFVLPAQSGPEVNTGVIEHAYGSFYVGTHAVKVTYTGGYLLETDPEYPNARLLPYAVKGAATDMCVHLYRNRDKLGIRSTSVGAMDVSEAYDGLRPASREMLEAFVFHG